MVRSFSFSTIDFVKNDWNFSAEKNGPCLLIRSNQKKVYKTAFKNGLKP